LVPVSLVPVSASPNSSSAMSAISYKGVLDHLVRPTDLVLTHELWPTTHWPSPYVEGQSRFHGRDDDRPQFLVPFLRYPASPCSRSSRRSSISSTPAENLTRPLVIPMAMRRSSGTEAWVIKDGILIIDSTPPRLSARRKI